MKTVWIPEAPKHPGDVVLDEIKKNQSDGSLNAQDIRRAKQ